MRILSLFPSTPHSQSHSLKQINKSLKKRKRGEWTNVMTVAVLGRLGAGGTWLGSGTAPAPRGPAELGRRGRESGEDIQETIVPDPEGKQISAWHRLTGCDG